MCVPPSSTSADGDGARASGTSTVWSTSVALPAVPTANWNSPPRHPAGSKRQRLRPDFGAVDARLADGCRGLHRREVLAKQTGLRTTGPDPLDPERRAP